MWEEIDRDASPDAFFVAEKENFFQIRQPRGIHGENNFVDHMTAKQGCNFVGGINRVSTLKGQFGGGCLLRRTLDDYAGSGPYYETFDAEPPIICRLNC